MSFSVNTTFYSTMVFPILYSVHILWFHGYYHILYVVEGYTMFYLLPGASPSGPIKACMRKHRRNVVELPEFCVPVHANK